MRVVVAPDSFKGTIAAPEAAAAIVRGWLDVRPADDVRAMPMADGGEGTLDALATSLPEAVRLPVVVPGPDDRPVTAAVLLLPDGTAVVELAATSGITLLDPLRPLTAHTRGFGAAIRAALDAGATRLLLAIGGSASTDGGTGALRELGARFLAADGSPVADGGAGLAALDRVDLRGLAAPPPGGVRVLTDVTSPLLGPEGAAAVFAPQKGADAADVALLEAALARLARLLPGDAAAPGAGAAGGTGFGLLAWGAVLEPGAPAVAAVSGLPEAVRAADLVITGEGRFDGQSARGKVPTAVRDLAGAVPVALVAGAITAAPEGYRTAVSLAELVGRERSFADPAGALRAAGAALAARFLPASGDSAPDAADPRM
ncbi:glycerate kinase [Amnibacterium setariae]|uniref:Glycerate kinase n=1 Tax=Amnibacterium setariae TaxID=2306585 RepID=A0A3A1TZ30_9MICO|nr:glycerate kinase [Amnibacterium setariae]RIX29975.1 glycerate kinase [Amnibacterium setariae]